MDKKDLICKFMISPYTINIKNEIENYYEENELQKIGKMAKETFSYSSPEMQLKYLEEYKYNLNKAAQMLIKDNIPIRYSNVTFIVEFF